MTNEEIISFLTKNKDVLHIADLFANFFRDLGFEIIKLLANLWNILAGSQSKALDLLDFSSYPKVSQFIQDFQPYGIMISAVCVIGLGFMVTKGKETELQQVLMNVAVATVLFIATPLFITNLNQITKGISNAILDDHNPSMQVFEQNVTDLYKLDEAKWKNDWGETTTIVDAPGHTNDVVYSSNYPNYLGDGDETYNTMNITEVMPIGGWDLFKDSDEVKLSDDAKGALKYKIGYVKGQPKLYKLENKWFNVEEAYYRYSWHPWIIFFTIVSGLIVSVFLIWRLVHLEMELGFSGIWGQLTSFTDLHKGKRNIQLIQTIVNCSVVIIAIFLLQKMNTLAWLFIDSLDWNLPLKVLVKVAVSAFIVNGPNVIEQMFGLDGGTRGFMQSVTGAAMGLNSMMGLGRSSKNTAKSMAKTGGKAANAAAGGATRGLSSLGGTLQGAGKSIFQKGQELQTKSANSNRNAKANGYDEKGTGNQHNTGADGESRLSKHTRSNTKSGSTSTPPSIFNGNRGGTTNRGTGKGGQAHSVMGNRGARNVLGNRTHGSQLNEALGQQGQQSTNMPMTNARRLLPTGGQTPSSVFPKANFSTRSMRRNQTRLNNALQSRRPYNQSRSQLRKFAKQNKEILRSGRG